MKKITLDNYTTDPYYPKIVQAVATVLQSDKVVSPVKVFIAMGLLAPQAVEEWRKGRIPYLERVLKCNLAKASRILRILRFHAHDLHLKPSMTVYRRKLHGRSLPLQFSKSGDRNLEEAYARHFVPSDQGTAHTALTTDPSAAAQPRAGARWQKAAADPVNRKGPRGN
jgi:hypothetical protein